MARTEAAPASAAATPPPGRLGRIAAGLLVTSMRLTPRTTPSTDREVTLASSVIS